MQYTIYSPTEIDFLKLKRTLLNRPDFEENIFVYFKKVMNIQQGASALKGGDTNIHI